MSYIFHTVPFKEGQSGRHTGLVQLGFILLSSLVLLILFIPMFAKAQQPCGNIVGPETFFQVNGDYENIVTVDIADCNDPFNVTTDPSSPYTLEIDGVEVGEGDTYIQNEPIQEINVLGTGTYNYVERFLFRHEGEDYVFFNEAVSEPSEQDYRDFASTYFETEAEVTQYMTILIEDLETGNTDQYFYDEEFNYLVDANTGEAIYDRYFNFQSAANNYLYGRSVTYEPGTYTLVIKESLLIVTQNSLWQKLRELFIKTAQAQYGIEPYIYTITFTIAEPTPEPTGASSVLFIPGIMGTKLYEVSSECDDELEEQERWYSSEECDQLRLKTDESGQSINDIYTYARESSVTSEIPLPFLPDPNIYASFLENLATWKENGVIADYEVVPYDWRLRLDHLVKLKRDPDTDKLEVDLTVSLQDSYIYETLNDLVASSSSGKVTIVAHSNGGQVIKYFLHELEIANDPLIEKIDNLILVAVPQVGTPEAIVGMLHGVDFGPNGLIMNSQTSRRLMSTAGFGQHLLPHQSYFWQSSGGVLTPVIDFEPGTLTSYWQEEFGPSVTTFEGLKKFITEESGRVEPQDEDLATPAVIDSSAFTYLSDLEQVLGEWLPSQNMRVYQVAGTGLNTPSGITYFTDVECTRKELFSCVTYEKKLGYRVNYVLDGDGTVVTPSALAMSESDNVERRWLNLDRFNNSNPDLIHRDILEVPDIREFILQVVQSATGTDYTYLSTSSSALPAGNRLVFQLHSPLDMYLTLSDGEVVSSSTETVRGVQYRRFGEVQTISIPEVETDFILNMKGLAEGSFTLDVEEYFEVDLVERLTYSAVPSGTSTLIQLVIDDIDNVKPGMELPVDYDGNDTIDVRYTEEGEVTEPEFSYSDLENSIEILSISKIKKQVLMSLAKVAEQLHIKAIERPKYLRLEIGALQVLKQKVILYQKLHWITSDESSDIILVVDYLIQEASK